MAINLYTDAGLSPRVNVYAERQMLRYAGPVIVLDKFGMTRPMPKNKSQTIKFRRPVVFSAATIPLAEGVTPGSTSFSYEDVTAVLKQYGQVVEITDVIEDTHEDPVLADSTQQAGDNIGRTIEALTYGVLKAGTNVIRANGTQRTDINTPIQLKHVRLATRNLKANKAMMITRMLDASVNYATRAIEGAYIAVSHTDIEADVRNLPSFTPVAEYGQRQPVHEQEIGSVESLRFIISPDLSEFADAGGAKAGSGTTMVSTTGTSADVYPVLVLGKEAYGTVPLRGQGAVSPTILRPGVKTKSDPLGQRGYVGWKTWFVAVILNQSWMTRIECAVTDLS